MSNLDCAWILLCYKRLPPLKIEIISIISSLIGAIITYCGLLIIPFRIDSHIYKTIFIINIPYFLLLIILNSLFMIFRHFDLIYNNLYLLGFILSIVEIYISLFAFITNLIGDTLTINNMQFYHKLSLKRKSEKYNLITPEEWVCTGIVFAIIFFCWINLLLLNFAENLLINLRINGSYHLYELAIKEEKKYKEEQDNNNNDNDNDNDNDNNNNNDINNDNNNDNNNDKNNNNSSTTEQTFNENGIKPSEAITKPIKENKPKDNENKMSKHHLGNVLKDSSIVFLDEKNDMNQILEKNEEKNN